MSSKHIIALREILNKDKQINIGYLIIIKLIIMIIQLTPKFIISDGPNN